MNDTDLLEAAAKAAGIPLKPDFKERIEYYMQDRLMWNPLRDDGEALRLAVQLSLEVSFEGDDEDGSDSSCCVGYPESSDRPCKIKYVIEQHNKDIFAATRRAIVRAAAEIGKGVVTPNAEVSRSAPLLAQVGSTDGLCGAVSPAPTFNGERDGH